VIARTQTQRLKLRTVLRNGAYACAIFFFISLIGLGAEILLRNREAAALEHQSQLLDQQIRVTQGEIQRADKLVSAPMADDLGAVGKLQSNITRIASEHDCTVAEFRSSAELSPYLTRFAKTTGVSGWGQVEVQISVLGNAKNVSATFASLVDSDVPFEFDSLEICRDKVNEVGDATVIGHATMRVLIRTAKDKA